MNYKMTENDIYAMHLLPLGAGAVELLEAIGFERVAERGRDIEFQHPDHPELRITLMTAERGTVVVGARVSDLRQSVWSESE